MRFGAGLIALAAVALISACSDSKPDKASSAGPLPQENKASPPQTQKGEASYLGENSKLVDRLVIRPTGAIVMLKEPCGVQAGFFKAKVFAYEAAGPSPSAQRSGCYREHSYPNKTIRIVESDGVSIGNTIVEVSIEEAFGPEHYFLPLDNDPRNQWPRIEALAVASGKTQFGPYYETIGLTRQPCPIDKQWFWARHIPVASADPYEKCWREAGNAIEVRDFDYSAKPIRLSEQKTVVNKDAFFEASTIHATPRKYSWQ